MWRSTPAPMRSSSRSATWKSCTPKKYLENANAGEKTLRYLLPILQQVELPDEAYYRIVEYCRKQGITFLCSAFDADSADFLETLGVPAYKVASADLTNLPLLDHLVEEGQTADPVHRHVAHARSRDYGRLPEGARRRVRPAALQQHLPGGLRGYQPALHGPAAPLRACRWATPVTSAALPSPPWPPRWAPASSSAT